MATITLFKAFVAGMNDYIQQHNANYGEIETTINQLLSLVSGQSGGGFAIPDGLKQIFDRKGIIGIGAYDFTEEALSGPDYNFTVDPGAFWDGASTYAAKTTPTTLSMKDKDSGTYYINLDSSGVPSVGGAAATNCVWQFEWNGTSISDKALYSGCAVLFDGDDYAACLESVVRAKTFTQLSARLEEIEALLAVMGSYYGYVSKSGLDFYYAAGVVRNDADISTSAAGHVTCTPNVTNFIEVDPATGDVSVNQVGFTSGSIPLWEVVAGASTLTSMTDCRTWALAGTGGGGGGAGHTQNTDLGTSYGTFTLLRTVAGAPSANATLAVERGTSPNVGIRWNETSDCWEYTNDGTNWQGLGDISLNLGTQAITKYVAEENPPKVWEEIGRSSSLDYEDLDLSGFITALQGVEAVVLQVFFWDEHPNNDVKVMFKKKGSIYSPLQALASWQGEVQPVTLIVPVDSDLFAQFFVAASGAGAASLQVFLIGYFEKILGVGTQEKSFVTTVTVAAGETYEASIDGFVNRGLCHYLKVAAVGAMTDLYNIKLLKNLPEPESDPKNYYAEDVDPNIDFEDWEPFWVKDNSGESKLHLQIVNQDLVAGADFTINMEVEQFA